MKKQCTLLLSAVVLFFSFTSSDPVPKYYEVCNKVRDISTEVFSESGLIKARPAKYMSRCPTGVRAHYDKEKNTYPMYEGNVVYYHGCSPDHLCQFQLNYKTGVLLVRSKTDSSYMSLEKWVDREKNIRAEAKAK